MKNIKSGLLFACLSAFLGVGVVAAAPKQDPDPKKQAVSDLKSKDPQVRKRAVETLGRTRDQAVAETLVKALADVSPGVRGAAVDALGLMRYQPAAQKISMILEKDAEPSVRQVSAVALGYIGDHSVILSLVKGVRDAHLGTRFACVNSLGILRDPDVAVTEVLSGGLKDADARMRTSCAYALGNIAGKSSVPALIDALKVARSTSPEAGMEAFVDANVGAAIIRSLGLIGDPASLDILKKALKDADKRVQIFAAQGLLKMKDPSGLAVARRSLKEPDVPMRRMSVEILEELGDASDVKVLQELEKSDTDPVVKQLSTRALGAIADRSKKKTAPAAQKKAAGAKTPAKPVKKGQ